MHGSGERDSAVQIAASQRDPNHRSTIAAVATGTALVGGAAKGLVFDRPRIALALPNARAQGKTALWAAELLSGHATNDIVPHAGGTIKLGSKVLTEHAWKHAYQASNALTLGLVGAQMLYGIPNLIDGLNSGDGLMETRSGRTGVFASLGGLFELGLFTFAALATHGSGGSRLNAILNHGIHQAPLTTVARIGFGLPVMANELGFLDFLNKGDTRSWLDTAKDTIGEKVDLARSIVGMDD